MAALRCAVAYFSSSARFRSVGLDSHQKAPVMPGLFMYLEATLLRCFLNFGLVLFLLLDGGHFLGAFFVGRLLLTPFVANDPLALVCWHFKLLGLAGPTPVNS